MESLALQLHCNIRASVTDGHLSHTYFESAFHGCSNRYLNLRSCSIVAKLKGEKRRVSHVAGYFHRNKDILCPHFLPVMIVDFSIQALQLKRVSHKTSGGRSSCCTTHVELRMVPLE